MLLKLGQIQTLNERTICFTPTDGFDDTFRKNFWFFTGENGMMEQSIGIFLRFTTLVCQTEIESGQLG